MVGKPTFLALSAPDPATHFHFLPPRSLKAAFLLPLDAAKSLKPDAMAVEGEVAADRAGAEKIEAAAAEGRCASTSQSSILHMFLLNLLFCTLTTFSPPFILCLPGMRSTKDIRSRAATRPEEVLDVDGSQNSHLGFDKAPSSSSSAVAAAGLLAPSSKAPLPRGKTPPAPLSPKKPSASPKPKPQASSRGKRPSSPRPSSEIELGVPIGTSVDSL